MAKIRIGDILVQDGKYGTVMVTRPSVISKETLTIALSNYAFYDIAGWLAKRHNGEPHELVHNAFPLLTASEREFLLTGITSAEWDSKVGDSEDPAKGHEGNEYD